MTERGDTGGPALITGASGFIGRHLISALSRRRRRIIALVRRVDSIPSSWESAVEVIAGDIRDSQLYAPYLNDGLTVFHLAAARRIPGSSPDWFRQINETAGYDLALACAKARVARFVYVSTAVVYGPSFGEPLVESNDTACETLDDVYIQTKVQTHVRIRKLIDRGLDLVTVCPVIVFGADEPTHPNRVTTQIRRLLRTRASVVIGGGMKRRTLVHVDDVVEGMLRAEERASCGDEFILGGADCSHREFNEMVFASAGLKPRCSLSAPAGMALKVARWADRARRHPRGCGYETGIRNLMLEWCYSSEKAKGALGFVPTPLSDAIQKTLRSVKGEPS